MISVSPQAANSALYPTAPPSVEPVWAPKTVHSLAICRGNSVRLTKTLSDCGFVNISELQLDKVTALLNQAGCRIPEMGSGGDASYVQQLLDALCELSSRDPLTGLVNRRHFMVALSQELDRVARSSDSALLLMVDIDHFKRINDNHGHLAGDAVIRAIGQALTECVRPMDTVARFGGEEFAIVFPSCHPTFADTVAERIREHVAALRVSVPSTGQLLQVTVSCGGAFAPQWIKSVSDAWIGRADAQLYLAKNGGRNRVFLEQQPQSLVSAEEKGLLFELFPEGGFMIDDPTAPEFR
ncbi:MAG: hypothetical protein RL323_2137 [Pseudomonadota bacterium]|jgi:diguanylate cyclase